MADERSVTVRLGMDTSQYEAGAQRASRATQSIGDDSESAWGAIQQAATTAGKATVEAFAGAGQVMVGLGAAALATGINYNALQQSSRAALTTILGSAEAANAQMDKLDAFAKGSPFSKQVWITAQQQMLGFGVEAGKVVPTLSAINDAVAAVGGNNQTVAELSYIFAQISASGKITAEDLNQFGQRGVDAATLIGSQMDMTGAEIRESITDGSLDAGQALDALAAGMSERFGGAAANVKETWAGALDRVKAAWRDISSIVAEPFVAKEGGGSAVQWVNSLADTMRAAQSKIGPIVSGLFAGADDQLGQVTDMFARVQDAIDKIDTDDIDKMVAHLKEIAPAIIAVGAGLTAGLAGSIPILNALPIAINPLAAGIGALALQSPAAREALAGLAAPALALVDAFLKLTAAVSGPLGSAVAVLATALQPIAYAAAGVAQAFTSLPGPLLATVAAFGLLVAMRGPLTSMWAGVLRPMQAFRSEMALQRGLAAMQGQSLGAMGAGFAVVRSSASGAVGGLKAFGSSLLGAVGGPAGLLITGALVAVTFGLYKLGDASRAAERSAQSAKSGFDGMVEAMRAANGVIDENVRASTLAAIKQAQWGRESSDLTDYTTRLGLALGTQVDALVGVAGASDQMESAYQRQRAALQEIIKTETEVRGSGKASTVVLNEKGQAAQRELTILDEQHAAYQQLEERSKGLVSAYKEQKAAIEGSADAKQLSIAASNTAAEALFQEAVASGLTADSIREQGEAAGLSAGQIALVVQAAAAAAGSQTEMATALDAVHEGANRAKQALEFFTQAVDRLAGRSIDAQLAEQQLNDQVRAIEQAFKDGTKATDGHIESLIRADGTIDTTSEAGSKLFGSINDYRSAYDNATVAAYQQAVAQGNVAGAADAARAAATNARQRFLDMAASQGIASDKAVILADKLGIVDGTRIDNKTFSVIAQGLGAAEDGVARLQAMRIDDKRFTVTQVNAIVNTQVNASAGGGNGLTTNRVNAGGGPIVGPGTGTSDSILSRVSAGEWVVTAARVKQYGALIRAIHAGTIPADVARAMVPGFAAGGPVVGAADASPAPRWSGMAGGTSRVVVDIRGFDIRFTGDGPITAEMARIATEQARAEIGRQVRAEMGVR